MFVDNAFRGQIDIVVFDRQHSPFMAVVPAAGTGSMPGASGNQEPQTEEILDQYRRLRYSFGERYLNPMLYLVCGAEFFRATMRAA